MACCSCQGSMRGDLSRSDAGVAAKKSERRVCHAVAGVRRGCQRILRGGRRGLLDGFRLCARAGGTAAVERGRRAQRHARQIKTMLTYCVRGERFGDGHWAAMIEGGHVRRLLERLTEMRSGVA